MNIVQKLSLNKHPKDVPDLSLVMAQNIKVSNDESCITNEEGIRENTYIKSFLDNYYDTDYKIVGIIPCNNELVIIAVSTNDTSSASIFRYREQTSITIEDMKCVYTKLKYHGGKIIGTFTYNVEESLILALSEYDGEINVPMKVINLGNYTNENIENDLHLQDKQLSLIPEVNIPNIINYNYITGSSYKGWYFLFIRYKINTVDYTQWYNFGNPIYLDNVNLYQIVRENFYISHGASYEESMAVNSGFSDIISENLDICNKTFTIDIDTNIFKNDYNTYQLGFICSNKTYTKCWRTVDINSNTNAYTLNSSNLIEHSITEFIDTYYNYFNVKNLINYNNRLYISNYKEINENINNENLQNIADSVSIVGNVKYINNITIDYDKQTTLNYEGADYKINKISLESIKSSFNNRCKNTTLMPDGIYNFYIHFIDKYGHATQGYKLTPNSNINNFTERYAIILPIDVDGVNYYYPIKLNETFYNYFSTRSDPRTVIAYKEFINNELSDPEEISIFYITTALYNYLISYEKDIYEDIYISQIINNAVINDSNFNFGITINTNGDYLFRIPKDSFIIKDKEYYDIKYTMSVKVPTLPNGYIGYYISYEKYESNKLATGVLVKRNANISGTPYLPDKNREKDVYENKMYFYSSSFDIQDSFTIKYNALSIDKINNVINTLPYNYINSFISKNPDYKNEQIITPTDSNILFILPNEENNYPIYPITNYKLAVANDATTNRIGKGTALELDDTYEIFNEQVIDNSKNVKSYIVSLYNYRNDIYVSENKILIRLSDYIYSTELTPIEFGYNGVLTYDSSIIYNDNGYVLLESGKNDGIYKSASIDTNWEYLYNGTEYTNTDLRIIPVSCVTYPIYDIYFHESKVINNAPVIRYNFVEDPTKDNAKKHPGSFVEPINSIDLFKNPQGSISDFYPMTNTNYREDLVNVIQFDKTIRRSNIIQDETRINNWRKFHIEGYKNITENKGKITNLVGIGSLFLVHTEHSMFMFDTSNTLEAVDQSIQLAQPDAFEVTYKEVFTSDLGFGGLQDKESAIIDQFGYIFYNNDSNRLYQFDNKQLAMIDDDIVEWLLRNKPYNVRFANDKQNNRLLIKFEYGDNQHSVLSYNYNIKSFISTHTYYFDKAYNTKINLYLRCDDNHNNCSLHQFIKNKNNYCSFDNVKSKLGTVINQDSKLSIIVNPSFEIIKYLEYFNYKLSKIDDVDKVSLTNLPVEGSISPFAGNKLKVYNDLTNTGELDISVNDEISKNIFANFDKPYWHLGVWNYSYLRNKLNEYPNIKSPDALSRIIGNYFIIEFTFDNNDNKLIEFEGLNYKVIR